MSYRYFDIGVKKIRYWYLQIPPSLIDNVVRWQPIIIPQPWIKMRGVAPPASTREQWRNGGRKVACLNAFPLVPTQAQRGDPEQGVQGLRSQFGMRASPYARLIDNLYWFIQQKMTEHFEIFSSNFCPLEALQPTSWFTNAFSRKIIFRHKLLSLIHRHNLKADSHSTYTYVPATKTMATTIARKFVRNTPSTI